MATETMQIPHSLGSISYRNRQLGISCQREKVPKSLSHDSTRAISSCNKHLSRGDCSGRPAAIRASMVTPEFTCSRASRLSRNTSRGKALVVRAAEGNKVTLEGGAPSSVPTPDQPPANQKVPLRRLGRNQVVRGRKPSDLQRGHIAPCSSPEASRGGRRTSRPRPSMHRPLQLRQLQHH